MMLEEKIITQWHPTKNGELTFYTTNLNTKVWWLGECNHEWQTTITHRKRGQGCPYCIGKKVLAGFNDLATTYPKLAAEWHPTKNNGVIPNQMNAGSERSYWWLGECGHEWEAIIHLRAYREQKCPYCSQKKLLLGFNDFLSQCPQAASEWHQTKNGSLAPESVLTRSREVVWWRCDKNHEWKEAIRNRGVGKVSCPTCYSRQSVTPEINDLASQCPSIAAQWHPTLNGDLLPHMVQVSSNKKVWWQCAQGHEWQAKVKACVYSPSCPCCLQESTINKDTLVAARPDLVSEWHPTLNGELTLGTITSLRMVVWWLGECGHEWDMSTQSRIGKQKQGCPICAGNRILVGFNDLATRFPLVTAEWHPTKNGSLQPTNYTPGSMKEVWWQCVKGHEWQTKIVNRCFSFTGCPYCSRSRVLPQVNDLATMYPQLALEWHPTLNGELAAKNAAPMGNKKVWWLGKCGHEWKAVIASRTRGAKCPQCAANTFVSQGEQEIANYLSQELGFTIEQSNRSLLQGRTEIDIYVPDKKLAIEYNGVYWHSTAKLSNSNYHLEKYKKARAADIQLLQVWQDEWVNKPELIKRLLLNKLGVSQEPLVGGRQTLVEEVPLAETKNFLNEYHIQGHANGSYYLGLRSKETNELVALMVLAKQSNPVGFTLEIVRYTTSCQVPGGFTKLLKHVEATLQPSRLIAFADHCISNGGLYAQNGFVPKQELPPDYWYLVNGQRVPKSEYRLARFKSDPSLLWEPNLTETQLAQLNGLHRIYDAGKTRWDKSLISSS